MDITINNKPYTVQAHTLAAIVEEVDMAEPYYATAVNGTFVPRSERAVCEIEENDEIEILAPMQGG